MAGPAFFSVHKNRGLDRARRDLQRRTGLGARGARRYRGITSAPPEAAYLLRGSQKDCNDA
jgi:hypothetical protein